MSLTVLVLASDNSYGSLDRSLLRRSRGRKRPEMFNTEDRDRQMSTPPEKPAEAEVDKTPPTPEPTGKKYKSRIDSWLKGAEEDAQVAERYLDKKKGLKQARRQGKLITN